MAQYLKYYAGLLIAIAVVPHLYLYVPRMHASTDWLDSMKVQIYPGRMEMHEGNVNVEPVKAEPCGSRGVLI